MQAHIDRSVTASTVRGYLALLRTVNVRLPYPDEMYEPPER
jgi:hypothetical protein